MPIEINKREKNTTELLNFEETASGIILFFNCNDAFHASFPLLFPYF
jgi:hypothetical protein